MSQDNETIHIVDFPPERRGMPAFQDLKVSRHVMYALLEVDVTCARKFMDDYKANTGEPLSFTG